MGCKGAAGGDGIPSDRINAWVERCSQGEGVRNVGDSQPGDGPDPTGASEGQEGVGPRFNKGADDLDQLEGIEKQQERSRKARREHEQSDSGDDPPPEQTYPLIDDIEKSRRRLKNRFRG